MNPLELIARAIGRVQVWGGCRSCGSRLARLQSGLCPGCVKAHEEATERARAVTHAPEQPDQHGE